MADIYYKNEVGRVVTRLIGEDVTGDTITFKIRKPDATVLSKSGSIVDATTGQVSYTTVAGDWDQLGEYIENIKRTNGTAVKYSSPNSYYVEDVIA